MSNITDRGEIWYKGVLLATFTEGQTVILHTEGLKAIEDIVIKNVGGVEEEAIISFTINEIGTLVDYQAEKGMTWREWVDSDYDFILNPSVDNECYVISDVDNLIYKQYGDFQYNWVVHNRDGTHVVPTDVIQAGVVYRAYADYGTND